MPSLQNQTYKKKKKMSGYKNQYCNLHHSKTSSRRLKLRSNSSIVPKILKFYLRPIIFFRNGPIDDFNLLEWHAGNLPNPLTYHITIYIWIYGYMFGISNLGILIVRLVSFNFLFE